MKKILFFVFTVIALASGCKSDSSQDAALKVLKWGPDEPVKIGTIRINSLTVKWESG